MLPKKPALQSHVNPIKLSYLMPLVTIARSTRSPNWEATLAAMTGVITDNVLPKTDTAKIARLTSKLQETTNANAYNQNASQMRSNSSVELAQSAVNI